MASYSDVDSTSQGPEPQDMSLKVDWWLNEIDAAKKREKDFRKDGKTVNEIYNADDPKKIPFNILYSNTRTLHPVIYSATPRPVVQRRYKDDDPLGKAAADAGQRMLEFLLDTNIEGYETFDMTMSGVALDALLPGRGVGRIKYDAETVVVKEAIIDPETQQEIQPAQEDVAWELVCTNKKHWSRVHFGYATKWIDVPWVAFEERIDRQEAVRLFDEKLANQLTYVEGRQESDEEHGERREDEERYQGHQKVAVIYEIWCKDTKEVKFLSPTYKANFLKIEDDPLGLTGFYPIPRPLMFVEKSDELKPTAPYAYYKVQADELNKMTRRIHKLIESIKARGVYDSALGHELAKIFDADENELVPADMSSTLASEKGIDNAIWMMPVKELIVVLQQLYQAREQCKQVIYEITGIADIMRGASKASETLGAQQIKAQWGGLRVKDQQKEVQRYARDLLRMMLELAATKFSEMTWARATGLDYLTESQEIQARQAAQMYQSRGQPLPPEIQRQAQKPTWQQVMEILQDDLQRAFRIDIETNSTLAPEAAEDQRQIAEVLNAMAQYLNGVAPLVMQGVMPFEAARSMMLAIARRFQFGREIEDEILAMQPPRRENEEQEQKQRELELALKQKDAEKVIATQQHELEKKAMKVKLDEETLKMEKQFGGEQGRTPGILMELSAMVKNINDFTPALQQVVQSQQNLQQTILGLMQAIQAPKQKVVVRGPDGKIVAVNETTPSMQGVA